MACCCRFLGDNSSKTKNNKDNQGLPELSLLSSELVFHYNGLVLGYKGLHDEPADEVGYGADAEHYHVGGGLTLEG